MPDLPTRIRRASLAAYETAGLDAVSARKIARRVRVSPMAMYRHFRDKDDLLDALVEEGFEVLVGYLRKADAGSPGLDRLRRRATCALAFALERPRLFELMFLLPRRSARRYPGDFAAGRSPSGNLFLVDVTEAIAAGQLQPHPPLETMLAIWALMHGLIGLYLAGRIDISRDRFRQLYRRSLDRLLLGLAAAGAGDPGVGARPSTGRESPRSKA
ncbi:MAG TPA: TetR/AcrR family transcriptional regulator [Gemmatimonadales bacterium]|jgi:AcrR family transcriptional regulator